MNTTTPPTPRGPVPGGRSISGLRVFLISGLGTALEYYDFLIYGLAAGLVFNAIFFPGSDPLIGTLYAFAAFGTGFLARPLGGLVIGHFGDRVGRRKMLIITLITMGVATFCIGLLPPFEDIGVMAPVLLVVLRLVQGFAAGGEWGGAALFGIENAPANRRGLWGSFTSMGIGLGTLLGAGVFAIVSVAFDGDLVSFAWRIPFWIGGVLVIIGLFARLTMPKTEAVQTDSEDTPHIPLVEAVRSRPRAILLSLGVSYGYNTIAYIGFTFFLSYLTDIGYGETESLVGQLVYSGVLFFSAPLFALLSDRIGRRWTMTLGGVTMSAFLFVYFPMVGTLDVTLAVLAFGITGLITGMTQGPIPAFMGEQFPARMRYSGMSASYQIGAAIGGGTAAFVATGLLILSDQNPISVALYGTFAMTVLVVCSLALRETAFTSTERINES
ncbi:MFS transporter [Spiractinospora alimapuensis]|uniref:MFS transporter n=1 Tax=Spiractinospora alimapuensis TaxID=2820884 RepID=UPI001F478875|nr:MFS transporter [Spiractinospora alimapuensis]QVQ52268.1 MFS transporter [Spiractinospora alimapuensis]